MERVCTSSTNSSGANDMAFLPALDDSDDFDRVMVTEMEEVGEQDSQNDDEQMDGKTDSLQESCQLDLHQSGVELQDGEYGH